jgi:phage FluMu protein Com
MCGNAVLRTYVYEGQLYAYCPRCKELWKTEPREGDEPEPLPEDIQERNKWHLDLSE